MFKNITLSILMILMCSGKGQATFLTTEQMEEANNLLRTLDTLSIEMLNIDPDVQRILIFGDVQDPFHFNPISPNPLEEMKRDGSYAYQMLQEERFEEAGKWYEKALCWTGDVPASYGYSAGYVFLKLRNFEKSVYFYDLAFRKNPIKVGSALTNAGIAFYNVKNYKKATSYFHQALVLRENLIRRNTAYRDNFLKAFGLYQGKSYLEASTLFIKILLSMGDDS